MDNSSVSEVLALISDLRTKVGPTGVMTLMAHVVPVSSGSRLVASMEWEIEEQDWSKDLRVHDTVIVRFYDGGKPRIVESVANRRSADTVSFPMPPSCPACGSPIIRDQGASHCSGGWLRCAPQRKEGLRHFISSDGMDIQGLAQYIDAMVDRPILRNPADLYRMGFTSLVAFNEVVNGSAQTLYTSIQRSKKTTLARFIFALGIRHVDTCVAKRLAHCFSDMDAFLQASEAELIDVAQLDEKTASSIHRFISDALNIEFIEQLRALGVSCDK